MRPHRDHDDARRRAGDRRSGRRTSFGPLRTTAAALAGASGAAVVLALSAGASPVPSPGPPGAGAPLSTTEAYAEQVVELANAERERAGCGALRTTARLTAAAQAHADDMAARGYYEHESPDGRDGGDRLTAAGYEWRAWGENIHRGPKNPERVMRDWMGSPVHRRNIVNCTYRHVGVGVNLRAGGPRWVQDFGAPQG